MTLTTLILLIAATWRISSLVANESGPFKIFEKFRLYCENLCKSNRFCASLGLYEGVTCEWCNSIWIGAIITVLCAQFVRLSVPELLGLPLALSTGAIVIKYLVQNLENPKYAPEAEPVTKAPQPRRRYFS
jgi:hypothetical protein